MPPENIDAMVEVQRVVDAPLATGERIFGRHGFRELLEKQAVRIIQPDIARTGGITEFKKIAAMADTYYISGRAAQPERTDLHGRLDPRLRLDPELPHPRVLRARRGRLQRDHPGRAARGSGLDPADRRSRPRHHDQRRVPQEARLRREEDGRNGEARVRHAHLRVTGSTAVRICCRHDRADSARPAVPSPSRWPVPSPSHRRP